MVNIYAGSIGIEFTFNTKTDLTNAASCDIRVKQPDTTVVHWTPVVETVATGVLTYTSETGDLDQAGAYYIQIKVIMTDGDVYYSNAVKLTVLDLFKVP